MAKIKVPQLEGVINVGCADAKMDNIVMKLVKDLPLTAMLRAETIITNFYISGISGYSLSGKQSRNICTDFLQDIL